MKSIALIFCCFSFGWQLSAQSNIDTLISAEKKFAKLALDKGFKEAFLANLDSNGVVFSGGKILNGIQTYQKQPAGKEKVIWDPAFAVISASGDLGVNTGPYQYFLNDTALQPLVQGQFTTVWHKTGSGEWKVLADMGIGFPDSVALPVKHIRKKLLPALTGSIPTTIESVLNTEKLFIQDYSKNGNKAFVSVISDEVWFNMNGSKPWIGKEAFLQKSAFIPAGILFTPVGCGISKSGDLGYVYGVVEWHNKKDNYLRIWQHEQEQWTLLLQVLLY